MKNTRISRLKRNKKFKQATKLLTVGLLVCPLAIGTIKALADEAETTPPVEQVEETPATTEGIALVEETETIEPVQPEVVEEAQPVIEQLTVTENFQEAETSTATPLTETVNYTIKCIDEETGNPVYGVSDITKSANKGDSITETAPEIEGFFVLESTTQTKTIGDNTVFTFMYRRLMPTNQSYDVIGDTAAKVGETKTYKYNKVEYWSNGTSIETIVNVEDTSLPLTSSDSSDVIANGTITFGSEGTRTLSASNAGISLEVTVTKDDVTPPTLDELKAEWDKIFSECTSIVERIGDKVVGTEFEEKYNQIFAVYDQCMLSESIINQVPTENQIGFYTTWLPTLKTALAEFKQLEKDLNTTQPETPSTTNPNNSSNGTNNTNNQTNNKQNSTTTTTKPAGNNTNKDGLPQTGEQPTTNAVIAGLSLTMLSILVWFRRKKV